MSRHFIGREDVLDPLCKQHRDTSPPEHDGPRISILHGMGGVGKTQISVKFARMYEERCVPNAKQKHGLMIVD